MTTAQGSNPDDEQGPPGPAGSRWRSRLRTLTASLIGFIPVLALFADELRSTELPFIGALVGVTVATNNVLASPAWRRFTLNFMPWLYDYEGKHRAE